MRYNNIKEYETEDLLSLSIDFDKYPGLSGKLAELDIYFSNGTSYSILNGDRRVIAVISIYVAWPGLGLVQIIPDREAHSLYKKSFIRGVWELRKILDRTVAELDLRRLQTNTIVDKQHVRWMLKLGFYPESVMQCYGVHGENHIMWVRLCQQK